MRIKYSSNNSGGGWWLKDEDWKKLEAAGWEVDWIKNHKPGLSGPDKEGRWLGALATRAHIEVPTPADAMRSFEAVTGQNVSDEGCNCCGAPHSFSWDTEDGKWGYASGEDCLGYLYPHTEKISLREAYERLSP